MVEQIGEWPDYSEHDPRLIPLEVISWLELLNHELITPEDVPAIQAFLRTPLGDELQGWARWREYWDTLDYERRREELKANPYYST